jgi:thiaminase/transcriptional activator TenA
VTAGLAADSWSGELWSAMDPIYRKILGHPFLHRLRDGTLDVAAFTYYLVQDVHYLRDYARCLAVVGAKAPTHLDTAMFARHAAGAVEAELSLHSTLLPALGLDPAAVDAVAPSPSTIAYTSYLLATVYAGSFAEGLAAVLPCYWIYQQVAGQLAGHGSPDPRYQQWIDAYAGEEFAAIVKAVLDVVDSTGPTLSPAERAKAQAGLLITTRYEWMFWDAAYRLEQWPI